MRPHRLEVTAFGAFAGTVAVDFDDLAAGGLFLLHGETGAGKSTLLDALGFALYGRVPGERATAKRLRSDHAGATARTEVRLEATLGGRRLRVTRSPEQSRPKKRGTGETTEPAKVLLEEYTGGRWTALSTRAGEADAEIADRLGMSADQFFQVVLLPQGEFARFLRAGSEDRAKLLERLFGTDRFRDVEQWLAERRRVVTVEVDELRRRISTAAHVIAQVAEVDAPEDVPDPLWAGDLLCQADVTAQAAVDRAEASRAALALAQAAAESARALADRQARRRAAQAAVAELAAAGPAMSAQAEDLAAAARAAEVAPVLAAANAAAAEVTVAAAAERGARERARRSGAGPEDDGAALRAGARGWEGRLGRLADLQATADAVAAEDRAGEDARRTRDELAGHLVAAAAMALELRGSRARTATDREAARAAAEALPGAVAEAGRLAEAASVAGRSTQVRAEIARLRGRHLTAREHAADLRDEALRLRRDRFDAMVAELAARLADDAPCPVCGSVDHPDPSEVRADRVTHEQEEAAAAAAEVAREAAEALGGQLAASLALAADLRTRLTRLCAPRVLPHAACAAEPIASEEPAAIGAGSSDATAGGDDDDGGDLDGRPWPDPAALAAAATDAAGRVELLRGRAGGLTRLDEALAGDDARLAELETMRAAAEEQRVAAARDALAADNRAALGRRTLAERLDGSPDLAAAMSAAAEGAEALAAAASAADALTQARLVQARTAGAALAASLEAGFADVAAAAAAARPPAWRQEVAERVARHRDAVAAAAAVLDDPDLAVPLSPAAEVAGAEALVVSAQQDHGLRVGVLAESRTRAAQLARLVPALDAECARLGPLADKAAEVRSLADLAAGQGQNSRRMTLSSYVLAARLEDVAAAAGERLVRMSQGRYTLVHTDAGRGNRRVGLGLLARDTWTGQDRDTATLSGGETFLASLALALGLADVVCAEAGGARLEALFVDEGFGSLDSDTLDEVMDVLDGLREGGRVVGLVSHVAELRQRIPTQLHVRKTPTGSDVSVVA